MSTEQADLIQSFRTFIKAAEEGASIPPVDEHDLKSLHELCIERAKRYCGKDGVISIEMTARACSPGANLPAAGSTRKWGQLSRISSSATRPMSRAAAAPRQW